MPGVELRPAPHDPLAQRVLAAFRQRFGREPAVLARAPGRVNLLGEHVDYNEGWVLPAAIDRNVWLAAGPRADSRLRVAALDFDGEASVDLGRDIQPASRRGFPAWFGYPAGVAWALRLGELEIGGLDATVAGDVPVGAGAGSSAAMEVAFLRAWDALYDLNLSPLELAVLGQMVENDFLDLQSGIMDQFASLHGRADHLIWLDCRTLEHRLIPFPEGLVVLVADSGVRRELAASAYNVRRAECEAAATILRGRLPGIQTLRDVTPADLVAEGGALPEVLARRARHVVEECGRVLDGAAALDAADAAAFGRLMTASHRSLRELYDVSIPELDVLVRAAAGSAGCYGARLTGAGFGGCAIALVAAGAAAGVGEAMATAFARRFGRQPPIYAVRPGPGAALYRP